MKNVTANSATKIISNVHDFQRFVDANEDYCVCVDTRFVTRDLEVFDQFDEMYDVIDNDEDLQSCAVYFQTFDRGIDATVSHYMIEKSQLRNC